MEGMTAVVYGTRNCSDCVLAKTTLDAAGVPFEWIDLGRHPEVVPSVLAVNGGRHVVPTVVLSDGTVLVEPTAEELLEAIRSQP